MEQGIKHDAQKPKMHLLPFLALYEVSYVMTFGGEKYGAYNWLSKLRCTRLLAAAFRHMTAWLLGEDKDPETGLSHLAHAAAGIMMALETFHRYPEMDDRFKGDISFQEFVQKIQGDMDEKV